MPRTKKPPSPLEKVVQKNAIILLRHLGFTVFRRNIGMMTGQHKGKGWAVRFSEPGQSDLWGFTPGGRHFEAETKRLGKRPTEIQLAWLKSRNGPHCAAWWFDNTATLERVARHLMAGGSIEFGEDDHYMLVGLEGE
jgi:hypothetical protein